MLTFQVLLDSFEKEFLLEIQSIQSSSPLKLYEPVAYSLKVGGKRIRPLLLLHAASLYSDRIEPFYPVALSVELFHNFTLLHDDIMDHAGIRRGLPTVHIRYGENSAILSGDAMSIMAFRLLSHCETTALAPMLSLFSKTALEVCEGQQFDMEFEGRDKVTISEYLEMIRLKTAVLIACSLKMGAMLGGADEQSCNLLYDFGIQAGIAFQLQDDWLDVYGEENSFGKKIGGDICENKKTFILLKALEMSSVKDRTALQEWIRKQDFDSKEKIGSVREIFSRSGAAEETKKLMVHYHDMAVDTLTKLQIEDSDKEELRNFAGQVLSRVK
jgi:geranylgeranyl diphosphate synthase, type II